MQHSIPVTELGPQGEGMANAVGKCVHCGICLATCPTYSVLGDESDSPRGRIYLMKQALQGDLTVDSVLPYVDRCLGCMACVTACPSGVQYDELLAPFRAMSEKERSRAPLSIATRKLVSETLPFPSRFRRAATMGRFANPLQRFMPNALGSMLELLPDQLPKADPLPTIYPAQGTPRARVALLAGCVQQVLSPQINWATLRVLARNGVETVIPKGQGCCGALSLHIGEQDQARGLASRNLDLFPADVDAIVTNAAGCGSGMHEYELLFRGTPREDQAVAFSKRVSDISVFLDDLGIVEPSPLPTPLRVAYHDACHLAHAQGVTGPPRRLLSAIPNVDVVEIPEGELCCGSAGTYNLEQPDLARQIGERKARNILSTGADLLATGNIGCIMQIQTHLTALGQPLPIRHTIEVLDEAYSR